MYLIIFSASIIIKISLSTIIELDLTHYVLLVQYNLLLPFFIIRFDLAHGLQHINIKYILFLSKQIYISLEQFPILKDKPKVHKPRCKLFSSYFLDAYFMVIRATSSPEQSKRLHITCLYMLFTMYMHQGNLSL